MDTIFESLHRALKRVTVNPNQDLEKLKERDNEFINHELRTLSEIETERSLEPNEEEKEVMLLTEQISRKYNTEEARNKAAKLEQDSYNYEKKLAETPSKFKEDQWVRLKTITVPRIPDGSEGVILEIFPPDFDLYLENDTYMYEYMLEIHGKHPETSQIIGSAVLIVDEDQLEAI